MPGKKKDLTGKRYNMLTVMGRSAPDKNGAAKWECLCDCGNKTVKYQHALLSGQS